MSRLDEVIVFTPNLARMRHFYERVVGLPVREEIPDWVQFDTRGAHLGLHALWEGRRRETVLVFEAEDFDARIASLRARGVELEVEEDAKLFGRVAWFRDPEGNLVDLHPPGVPHFHGRGPELPRVILNCRDLAGTVAFYREMLDLGVSEQSSHWVELAAGGVTLALHAWPTAGDHPAHAGQKVVAGFETRNLTDWMEALRARGLEFTGAPVEEDFGAYAEASDPDGNILLFRQPPAPESQEERLAEAFEDDGVPRQSAFRKPLKKGSKAVSRVAVRPSYKEKSSPKRKRPSATTRRVSSVRGSGPDRTRVKPKRTADEKKARGKPAIGRAKKATLRVMNRKKRAVARASRGKPVKRASARRGRR